MTERARALDEIGAELGVMARRFKALVAERATRVHPALQPASYVVLNSLIENGPTRGSVLACQFGIDKGAISRHIQHLVELGLAERSVDPQDGRAHLVFATPEAIRLVHEVHEAQQQSWKLRLSEWSDADLQGFALELRRFNDHMSEPS